LQEFSFQKERMFRHWNFRDGWVTPNQDPTLPPESDGNGEPYGALRRIMDLDGQGNDKWDNCVLAMVWVEGIIGQHPPFEECLRQYARDFPESRRRLVIVAAEGFNLPPKLQHDIPILDFDLPDAAELREVYLDLSGSIEQGVAQPLTEAEVTSLSALGAGMTEPEFELACAKAIALKRSEWPALDLSHFKSVVSDSKTEIVRRSEVLELMQAEDPKNIGGLDLLKDWIDRRKKVFSQEARDAGVDAPRGMVLIGSPGTGKSICAKAISSTLGLPLIKFDISRCFAGIVGQSESLVRAALKQVEAMAPCVVFLDEVDKAGLSPQKGGGDAGVSDKVLGALLTFMQDSEAPMFWVLTANRPDSLPPELLRKGRMDEVFSVLPPNREEREQIIRIHLAKRKQRMVRGKDLSGLLEESKGYVGAEIEAAIKEACVDAYVNKTKVTGTDIRHHLSCMKPISIAFKEDFGRMTKWARDNARPSSIPEAEAKSVTRKIRRGRVLD
jgi:SpoVK/Ycf46/Vps4 family AAA+-type ATPase